MLAKQQDLIQRGGSRGGVRKGDIPMLPLPQGMRLQLQQYVLHVITKGLKIIAHNMLVINAKFW